MAEINAILGNATQDIGDILERIPWGNLWIAKAEWDGLEEHFARLQSWDQGLSSRLTFWQGQKQRLERDPRHGLLQEMLSRDRSGWLSYLNELAQKQKGVNDRLRAEIAVLEKQLAKRQEREQSHG